MVQHDRDASRTDLDHTSHLSSGSSTPSTISTTSGSEYLEDCEVAYLDSRRLSFDDPLQKDTLAVTEPEIRDDDVDSTQLATNTGYETTTHSTTVMKLQEDKSAITSQKPDASDDELPLDETLREILANLE